MKVLIVDSSKKRANVQVITEDKVAGHTLDETEKHSENLLVRIDEVLARLDLELSDIDVYASVVGPGSFTGIRVGMSTIKGFNKVENKSIVSMNMFEVLSQSVKNGIVLLNSTNTSCYFAKIKNKKIIEDGVVDKNAITELANGETVYVLAEEQSLIESAYKDYKVINSLNDLYESCIIAKLNNMEYGEFLPYYLQLSQAERNLKND